MTVPVPPPELVQQWASEWMRSEDSRNLIDGRDNFMATRAAQYGADQELRAVCQLLFSDPSVSYTLSDIRAARRPKPPSLKEQALEQLDGIAAVFRISHGGKLVCDTIRRALEQLDD